MALNYENVMPIVKEVAASVSSYYPAYVLTEDTEGELLLFVYAQRNNIASKVADNPDIWERWFRKILRKRAHDFCASERAATEGYDPSDIYRYSIPKIQTLIVDVFDYADWQSFERVDDGQPRSKSQANTTGDRIAELTDIKNAMMKVNQDTFNILCWRYRDGYSIQQIADASGVVTETAKKRAQRALKALQKQLGYKSPEQMSRRPERRTVRSNAASRADLSQQYDG